MADLHTLRIEAVVALDHADHLTDVARVEGLLVMVADEVGSGQSAYDPSVVDFDGSDGGLTGACLFPGGVVTVHTFGARGRIPGRYALEVTSCEPVSLPRVLALAEQRLGIPSDRRAHTITRGW